MGEMGAWEREPPMEMALASSQGGERGGSRHTDRVQPHPASSLKRSGRTAMCLRASVNGPNLAAPQILPRDIRPSRSLPGHEKASHQPRFWPSQMHLSPGAEACATLAIPLPATPRDRRLQRLCKCFDAALDDMCTAGDMAGMPHTYHRVSPL